MQICVSCKRVMSVEKTGIGVNFGNRVVYWGDMFKCPDCAKTVIVANNTCTPFSGQKDTILVKGFKL